MSSQTADRPIVVTSINTTGPIPGHHEILDIGIVVVNPRTFDTLLEREWRCYPCYLNRAVPAALEDAHYCREDWVQAMSGGRALEEYVAVVGDRAIFCGSVPALRDWTFLREEFETRGVVNPFADRVVDISTIAWSKFHDRVITPFDVCSIASMLKVSVEPEIHRAINRARTAARILPWLMTPKTD